MWILPRIIQTNNNKDQLTCSPHVFTKNDFRIQSDICFDDKTITNKQFNCSFPVFLSVFTGRCFILLKRNFLPKEVVKELKRKWFKIFLLPDDVIHFFQSVARHLSCPYNQDITFLLSLLIQLDVLTFFVCVVCLCFISVLQKRQWTIIVVGWLES